MEEAHEPSLGIPSSPARITSKEPWFFNQHSFQNPQKAFIDAPPLFTELYGATPRSKPIVVRFGICEDDARALVARSLCDKETALREYVPGDRELFASTEAYARWLQEANRFPFMARAQGKPYLHGEDVAAFFWFTEEAVPEKTGGTAAEARVELPQGALADRLSVRVYQRFAGKGIAEALGAELLRWHGVVRPEKSVWLTVRADNARAISVYENLCFEHERSFRGADGGERYLLLHNRARFQESENALPYAV